MTPILPTYFIAATFTLFAQNTLASCQHETQQRSHNGNVATEITFTNQRQQTLHIYWLNYQGKRIFYQSLQAGQNYLQPTYVTHPWVITSEQGKCLGIYYPDAQPRNVIQD